MLNENALRRLLTISSKIHENFCSWILLPFTLKWIKISWVLAQTSEGTDSGGCNFCH